MQKKLDPLYEKKKKSLAINLRSYTTIFNKLSEWQFPTWPSDPIGCTNLLIEQAKTMSPYLLPLHKLNTGLANPIIASFLTKEIKSNGVVPKVTEAYENWLKNCPCIKEQESQIKFTINNDSCSTPITFNFLRMTYGLLKVYAQNSWSRKRRVNNSNNIYLINYLYTFTAFLIQEAKIEEVKNGKIHEACIRFQPYTNKETQKNTATNTKNPIYKILEKGYPFTIVSYTEEHGVYDESLNIERPPR